MLGSRTFGGVALGILLLAGGSSGADESSPTFGASGEPPSAATEPGDAPLGYRSDRLIIRFEPMDPHSAPEHLNLPGISELRRLLPVSERRPAASNLDGPHLIYVARPYPGIELPALAARLERRPEVRYAELDTIIHIDDTLPNDPEFPDMWGLENTGQTGGTSDSDIDAPLAWDLTTGSSAVVVGVVDTGVDFNHVDLADNMWTNVGEVPGDQIDNDNNGYVDDVHGYDFLYDDSNPSDSHSHGSHVAGTIAAVGNNGIGTTGVAWTAQVMALRTFNVSGSGSTADAVEAFYYGIDNGARILSNSWSGGSISAALQDAVSDAEIAGVLMVAAAGNSSRNSEVVPHFPASYDFGNVIAVAATDDDDGLPSFSNFGEHAVDLGAPGVSVLSSVPPYVDLFFENFEATTLPGLGAQFTASGSNNLWGTIVNSGGNIVARGDALASDPYSPDSDGWITTPVLDTNGLNGTSLQFLYRYETADSSDSLVTQVWDGSEWRQVFSGSGFDNYTGSYSTAKIDLDPYQNDQMQLRFGWFTNGSESGYYGGEIDDVRVRYIGSDYSNPNQVYQNFSGTSMATPHVSGVAALLLAQDPTMTVSELRQRIIWSGDPIPALDGMTRSGRRLNAFGALTAALSVALPGGGDDWVIGSTREIEWIPEEGGTADLFLLEGGTVVLQIADDTPNDGVLLWTIPPGTSPSAQARIRVETASLVADSGLFTLREGRAWYVDETATGADTGLSWSAAFPELEPALGIAEPGDQIWVATGVYSPSERVVRNKSRSVAFRLRSGVSIYGGFAGTETLLIERSPILNPTILSADLDGDDESGGDNGENAYHVAVGESRALSPALLDGFTLSGGNANDLEFDTQRGGALLGIYSTLRVTGCSFSSNTAPFGGCVATTGSESDEFRSCDFDANTATQGGALRFFSAQGTRLIRCSFVGNSASDGGALYTSDSTIEILNCTFRGNDAASGGAIDASDGDMSLINCEFYGNIASASGGALALSQSGTLRATNSTFVSNQAAIGGAMEIDASTLIAENCILWGNVPSPVEGSPGTTTVSSSCVEGGFAGTGNISDDPLFIDGSAGNLRLGATSPAIDAGDDTLLPLDFADLDGDGDEFEILPIDFDGDVRSSGGSVDMGAFEVQSGFSGEFVRSDCNGDGGVNIADPVAHLEELFAGGNPASCRDACDANDDGTLNIADPIYSLAALFTSGPPPQAPFPTCGSDPTPDGIGCGSFAACP